MRILQVIHDFLPRHAAGSELYCFYLSKELARRNDVSLLFTETDASRQQYDLSRGEYEGLKTFEVVHNHRYRGFEDTYSDPKMEAVFERVLDEVRPDVVHLQHLLFHSVNYIPIAKKRGIPVVFTLHDYWLSCPNGGQRIRPNLHVCDEIELDGCADCIRRFSNNSLAARLWTRLTPARDLPPDSLLRKVRTARVEAPRGYVRLDSLAVGGDRRASVITHPPARVEIEVGEAAEGTLRFGVAMDPAHWGKPGGGVAFDLLLDGEKVWSRTLDPKSRPEDRGWFEEAVELPPTLPGSTLTLVARPAGSSGDFCRAGWSDLRWSAAPGAGSPSGWPSSLLRPIDRLMGRSDEKGRREDARVRLERVVEACSNVDLFLAPSPFLARQMVDFGLPADRVEVSDYGMQIGSLGSLAKRPSESLRFGYVGTLVAHKGVHVLVDAFGRLRESHPEARVELLIYGNETWFEAYVGRLKAVAVDGVEFLGEFDNTDASATYAGIDVLVVPSVWWENAPITIHEAILSHTPVIASNFGGMADFVKHGRNGLLFSVGSSTDLAHQMGRLIDEPGLLGSLQEPAVAMKTIEDDAAVMEARYRALLQRESGS